MHREIVLLEWQEAVCNTLNALISFHSTLHTWGTNNHNTTPEDFNAELDKLADAGLLYDWADRNKAGGGLDNLFEAVTGSPP